MLCQLAPRYCIDQVAFAKGRPVQAVCFVQYQLVRFSPALCPLGRAQDYFHIQFLARAVGMGETTTAGWASFQSGGFQ